MFRAWPYLYKGTLAYERQYLPRYAEAKTGTLIVAEDDGKIVGASTALGLDEEDDFVQEPFLDAGMDLTRIFYFGESVLLPDYRGQGIGVRFFEEREAAARPMAMAGLFLRRGAAGRSSRAAQGLCAAGRILEASRL